MHKVPAQRVTQSQLGREAAKRGNGEFQVNTLCFHNNSWSALKSPRNNSLKDSGGTGGNYHITHLFTFPLQDSGFALRPRDRYSLTQATTRHPVLPLVQALV